MSDNKVATIHLGDVIYADIDSNEYLREIHDNLLYNYAAKMLRFLYKGIIINHNKNRANLH